MDVHFCIAPAEGKGRPKELATPGISSVARLCSIQEGLTFPREKVAAVPRLHVGVAQRGKDGIRSEAKMWVHLGGTWRKMRLRISLSVVSGDQKLQDYLCGRKASNNGSAGHVHHGCMASAVYATAVGPGGVLHGGCQKPPTQVLRQLNDLALMDVSDITESGPISQVHQLLPVNSRNEQLEKRRALELFRCIQKLSIGILGSIFTMHDFGANEHGILVATAEDHLHSFEWGVMLNLSEVAYGGLTDTERNELECTIWMTVRGCSSSVLAKYPRGTLKTDFGKLINCSHKEKVGSVFYLLIGLHTQ
jgi:hypothetical protein